MRRLFLTALTAAILTLAPAGAATAATPFTAGSGTKPDVAVGFDGAAHVAWTTGLNNVKVGYCRVGQFSESCDETKLLDFPGVTTASSIGRAVVSVPAPEEVLIVAGCTQCPSGVTERKAFLWRSTDNGVSFEPEDQIGTEFELHGAGAWVSNTNLFVAANSNSAHALTDPPLGPDSAVPFAPPGYSFDGEVVRQPGTNILVGTANDIGRIGHRAFTGFPSAENVNDASKWGPIRTIEEPGATLDESSLSAGGAGTAVVYRARSAGATRLAVRRFIPATEFFGPPAFIQGSNPLDAGLQQPDSYQDLTGRMSVVWRVPGSGGLLRYRQSDTTGNTFGSVGTLASGENFTEPEIGVGNETGYVVWTQGNTGPVRVVRVDPSYDLPPTTPTPSGSDSGSAPGPAARPALTGATIGDRTLRPGEGTTFRFTSSVAGEAVLTIEKQYQGLKVKRKGKGKKGKPACLPRTPKRLRALRRKAATTTAYRKQLKKLSCRAYRRVGEIRRPVRAGVNTIAFDGRVAGRPLGRGSYRANLVVTDSAGRASSTESLVFKIVGAAQKGKGKGKAKGRPGRG